MDKYKIFSWDPQRFPNPKGMVTDLKAMGFHTVTIHDPGIKVEPGYKPYDDGTKLDLWAKYPDGKPHISNVWPGRCVFPDFTMQKTRDWWRESLKAPYTDNGVDGFWNDMNEPATWGNRFPDLVQFSFEGKMGSHRRAHNIYGLMMSKASYEAGRALLGRRPFILTLAGYSVNQRYSAVWTGDNRSEDSHMMAGVRLMNSMGLSGIAYTGMDVGGFTGNPTPALFGRWSASGLSHPSSASIRLSTPKKLTLGALAKRLRRLTKTTSSCGIVYCLIYTAPFTKRIALACQSTDRWLFLTATMPKPTKTSTKTSSITEPVFWFAHLSLAKSLPKPICQKTTTTSTPTKNTLLASML
jgi:hypothetical protein